MTTVLLVLVLVVVVALVFDYINGFHDTANAVATVVSTGVLPIRTAVLLSAVLNFAGALLGMLDTGDEVVLFEPMYDSYQACIALAGAVARPVLLRPDETGRESGRYWFDPDELRAANLPPSIVASWQRGRTRSGAASEDLRSSLKAAEKDALLKVLARTSWNVSQAAKELGLPRRTVVYRMSRLGLRRPRKTT